MTRHASLSKRTCLFNDLFLLTVLSVRTVFTFVGLKLKLQISHICYLKDTIKTPNVVLFFLQFASHMMTEQSDNFVRKLCFLSEMGTFGP